VAFDSTHLLASGSWDKSIKSGTRTLEVCWELKLVIVIGFLQSLLTPLIC
jgi:hypothetical protein